MPPVSLDDIDRRILGILQRDLSLSVQAVADLVGLSSNACWRRIKILEERGVIARRVAILDLALVGLGLTTFVTLKTDNHNAEWLTRFARAVQAIPEIVECHRLSGQYDYLLKVVVGDIGQYDRVYQRLIAAVPGLSDVSSTFSMERMKYSTAVELSTAI
jgi:Lrp/AsnC family transcriptional regulator